MSSAKIPFCFATFNASHGTSKPPKKLPYLIFIGIKKGDDSKSNCCVIRKHNKVPSKVLQRVGDNKTKENATLVAGIEAHYKDALWNALVVHEASITKLA